MHPLLFFPDDNDRHLLLSSSVSSSSMSNFLPVNVLDCVGVCRFSFSVRVFRVLLVLILVSFLAEAPGSDDVQDQKGLVAESS